MEEYPVFDASTENTGIHPKKISTILSNSKIRDFINRIKMDKDIKSSFIYKHIQQFNTIAPYYHSGPQSLATAERHYPYSAEM